MKTYHHQAWSITAALRRNEALLLSAAVGGWICCLELLLGIGLAASWGIAAPLRCHEALLLIAAIGSWSCYCELDLPLPVMKHATALRRHEPLLLSTSVRVQGAEANVWEFGLSLDLVYLSFKS
ncbi:hypothetical protein Ae201684_015791 [Aphanomyces euteiches]|uniref:Uncharacterized protein n=1 Tax=Aphanomyces euteiches TaxID=100861 RepID=A0A6G0WEL5_9STRA|nr:hypothetical protein Ae201684_015791 [Aphanomyces euteiches]